MKDDDQRELEAIREEIKQHKLALIDLRKRRKTLERRVYEGYTGEQRSGDSILVPAYELRHVVTTWVTLYNGQHGGKGGSRTLSERAQISTRIVRKIKNGGDAYGKFITLDTVERILKAIDNNQLIHDLTFVKSNGNKGLKVPEPPPSVYWEE
jgi:hypothetical protein